jgi:hypothetical protein
MQVERHICRNEHLITQKKLYASYQRLRRNSHSARRAIARRSWRRHPCDRFQNQAARPAIFTVGSVVSDELLAWIIAAAIVVLTPVRRNELDETTVNKTRQKQLSALEISIDLANSRGVRSRCIGGWRFTRAAWSFCAIPRGCTRSVQRPDPRCRYAGADADRRSCALLEAIFQSPSTIARSSSL